MRKSSQNLDSTVAGESVTKRDRLNMIRSVADAVRARAVQNSAGYRGMGRRDSIRAGVDSTVVDSEIASFDAVISCGSVLYDGRRLGYLRGVRVG